MTRGTRKPRSPVTRIHLGRIPTNCVCVFKAPRTYTPVLGALVSPSGHSRGLYWHPAVGCGNVPSPCEWADASQAIIPMARKGRTRAWAPRAHRDTGHLRRVHVDAEQVVTRVAIGICPPMPGLVVATLPTELRALAAPTDCECWGLITLSP